MKTLKNIHKVLILIFFALTGSSNIMVSQSVTIFDGACLASPATLSLGSVINGKNSYVSGGAFLIMFWDSSESRWEVHAATTPPAGNSVMAWYNDADSTPNPPDLTLGSWIASPLGCGSLTQCDGTGTQSALVLPIELISFQLRKTNSFIALDWETAAEYDNEKFEIEKSLNGIDFFEIATIRGAGTTDQKHEYRYSDESPSDGMNYYRLRQVDYSGQYSYSNILSEYIHTTEKPISLFPNPSPSGQVQLNFFANQRGNIQINVFNSTAQLVQSQNIDMVEGQNNLSLELEEKGVFYIQVIQKNSSYTKKLIIQ